MRLKKVKPPGVYPCESRYVPLAETNLYRANDAHRQSMQYRTCTEVLKRPLRIQRERQEHTLHTQQNSYDRFRTPLVVMQAGFPRSLLPLGPGSTAIHHQTAPQCPRKSFFHGGCVSFFVDTSTFQMTLNSPVKLNCSFPFNDPGQPSANYSVAGSMIFENPETWRYRKTGTNTPNKSATNARYAAPITVRNHRGIPLPTGIRGPCDYLRCRLWGEHDQMNGR